jgi:hypothetical protein
MYDTATGHEVRTILKAIAMRNTTPTEADVITLRTRVYAAVDELKAMGWPIERIIVRLKEVAYEVGLPPWTNAPRGDRASVMAEIVRHCIDRYYSELM